MAKNLNSFKQANKILIFSAKIKGRQRTYFGLAQIPRIWRELDEWLRHRLRAIQRKQWQRGMTIYRELLALGVSPKVAQQSLGAEQCVDDCLL